jgi:hypothetical protein
MALKVSTDRKTAPSVTPGGSPNVRNAFGLPSGRDFSCPGQTSVCGKVCYAGKLEVIYKAFMAVMLANWNAIKDASFDDMVTMLSGVVADYRADLNKVSKRREVDNIFRIHHDGDFFSLDYARAWAQVVRNNPDVQFWVYTRSFIPSLNVVPIISGIPNLTVYLSVDDDNKHHVPAALISAKGIVRVATLSATAAEAKAMVPSTTGKSIIPCPEVIGKLPLVIGNKGDEGRVGACAACGICVTGRKDVAFSISGK